jgi:hypothetical protein
MKKEILNIGKVLNKTQQKAINGGSPYSCDPQYTQENCDEYCHSLMTIFSGSATCEIASILESNCGISVEGCDSPSIL